MDEKILTEQELETVTEVLATEAANSKDTQAIRAIVEPESVLPELDTEDLPEVELEKTVDIITEYGDDVDGMSISDIQAILDIKRRLDANEKFSVFNALPEAFKTKIKEEAIKMGMVGNRQFLNIMAREAVNTLIAEANINKEFEAFQSELTKLTNLPTLNDAYIDNLRDMMENKLTEKALAKKDEGDEEAYKQILDVSCAFSEAYTSHKQVDYIWTQPNIVNTLLKHYNKPDRLKRLMEDFDYTLSKSQLKPKTSIKEMYETLLSLKIETTNVKYEELCAHFVTTTCLYCRNMKPDNIVDVTFMYYTMTLFSALRYTQNTIGFSAEIIKNFLDFDEQLAMLFKKETEV